MAQTKSDDFQKILGWGLYCSHYHKTMCILHVYSMNSDIFWWLWIGLAATVKIPAITWLVGIMHDISISYEEGWRGHWIGQMQWCGILFFTEDASSSGTWLQDSKNEFSHGIDTWVLACTYLSRYCCLLKDHWAKAPHRQPSCGRPDW